MKVERINNEIKLTFPEKLLDSKEIQDFIDYIRFREVNSQSKASQEQVDELAEEINQIWWKKNKHKFE